MEMARFENMLTGEVVSAHTTTEHAASSYGQPVWVNNKTGEAFDLIGMRKTTVTECFCQIAREYGCTVEDKTDGSCICKMRFTGDGAIEAAKKFRTVFCESGEASEEGIWFYWVD